MEELARAKPGRQKIQASFPVSMTKYWVTQADIAAVLGVSNVYISQIVKSMNLKTFKARTATYVPSSSTREMFKLKGYQYPGQGKVYSMQILKGGGGKTSCLVNVALRLCHYGCRVAILDMDPQGNATTTFGAPFEGVKTFANVISEKSNILDAMIPLGDSISILPSNFDNSVIDNYIFSNRHNLETFVADIIAPLKEKFDYILVDCNPSLSALNTSIALASDEIILPVNPDKYSYEGANRTVEEFMNVSAGFKKKLNVKFLLSKFDFRTVVGQEYLLKFKKKYGDQVMGSVIRYSNDIAATLHANTTIYLTRGSNMREDYDRLTREIMEIPVDETVPMSGRA